MILIIFGVMLTSTSPFSRFEPTSSDVVIALSTAMLLLTALVLVATRTRFPLASSDAASDASIGAFGQSLLGEYIVPFELASVLLLVVLIGAAYIARGRRSPKLVAAKPG